MILAACQSTGTNQSLPTLARFPTSTPSPIASKVSSFPSSTATATSTVTASATITDTVSAPNFATRTFVPFNPTAFATSAVVLSLEPVMTATALPEVFVFGQSAGGKDLKAFRYGTGSKIIMLVGGIHAGFEANTVELMQDVQQYLENNPAQIKSEITFLIIPSLNPDGLAKGRVLDGRFNGHGVDLNRNWGCDWSADAVFQDRKDNPGEHAFSEPETIALGSLIQSVKPVIVLFYHAAADGVFEGTCVNHETVSAGLAAFYGQNSGYSYGKPFTAYEVTGTAPSWVASLGIPSLDVELSTSQNPEFDRNIRAIIRLQDWLINP